MLRLCGGVRLKSRSYSIVAQIERCRKDFNGRRRRRRVQQRGPLPGFGSSFPWPTSRCEYTGRGDPNPTKVPCGDPGPYYASIFTKVPLTPLALRREAALLADSSKIDGTAAEDLLLLDDDVVELVDDDVDEVEAVLEDDAAEFLAVGWIG